MNPLQMMIQMRSAGQNPMTLIQQMSGRDPRMAQFLQMTNGKSPQQLEQLARNVAKERGVSIEQLRQQLGI